MNLLIIFNHLLIIFANVSNATFSDHEVNINGYNIYRKYINKYGGRVAIYIQSHIPVKIRQDLMPVDVEALCLQVQLPLVKSVFVGCCYRPLRDSPQSPATTITQSQSPEF